MLCMLYVWISSSVPLSTERITFYNPENGYTVQGLTPFASTRLSTGPVLRVACPQGAPIRRARIGEGEYAVFMESIILVQVEIAPPPITPSAPSGHLP